MFSRAGRKTLRKFVISPRDCNEMGEVRAEIDRLDEALVRLIAERQRYIEAAARIKEREDEVRLQWRIDDVLGKVKVAAAREGLEWSIAEPVWREMMDRCIAHEGVVWRRLRGREG
jgi:isochorismate pyruvate lyase